MGYGIALNSNHIPWNLLPWGSLKNNPTNVGNLNNQSGSDLAIPLKDTNQKNNAITNNGKSIGNNNPLNTNQANPNSDNSNQASGDPSNTKITPSEAQSIANKYILEPGATSGSPQNVDIAGKNTYVVPVKSNGKTVGEIDIDPKTGKNVGGAGGAPE